MKALRPTPPAGPPSYGPLRPWACLARWHLRSSYGGLRSKLSSLHVAVRPILIATRCRETVWKAAPRTRMNAGETNGWRSIYANLARRGMPLTHAAYDAWPNPTSNPSALRGYFEAGEVGFARSRGAHLRGPDDPPTRRLPGPPVKEGTSPSGHSEGPRCGPRGSFLAFSFT
jgi:hypothetical protein